MPSEIHNSTSPVMHVICVDVETQVSLITIITSRPCYVGPRVS